MLTDTAQENALDTQEEAVACFVESLVDATYNRVPCDHWLLENALPEPMLDALRKLDFNKSSEEAQDSPIYFSGKTLRRDPVCRAVADLFTDPIVLSALEEVTGADLSESLLRLQYCVDALEAGPSSDLSLQFLTIVIGLSAHSTIMDPDTDLCATETPDDSGGVLPDGKGKALIFIPTPHALKGLFKHPVNRIQKSLSVTYVSPAWRRVHELVTDEFPLTEE